MYSYEYSLKKLIKTKNRSTNRKVTYHLLLFVKKICVLLTSKYPRKCIKYTRNNIIMLIVLALAITTGE